MKVTILGTAAPACGTRPIISLDPDETTASRDNGENRQGNNQGNNQGSNQGDTRPQDRRGRCWHIPAELPVAFVVNDTNYAIMMASPDDMADYAIGFALTEGLVRDRDELEELVIHHRDHGIDLRLTLDTRASARFSTRQERRQLTANTSCGLCGLDSAERLFAPLPAVAGGDNAPPPAQGLHRALAQLRDHQPLNRLTKSVHAAAWADMAGSILYIREDVGRHNAVDKLIGVLMNQRVVRGDGFLIVSSRCSYEIIEKASRGGIANLLSVSAPTVLALDKAGAAGIRVFCREGQAIIQIR